MGSGRGAPAHPSTLPRPPGVVSREELVQALAAAIAKEQVHELGPDYSDSAGVLAWMHEKTSAALVRAVKESIEGGGGSLFSRMDANGDGMISVRTLRLVAPALHPSAGSPLLACSAFEPLLLPPSHG